MALTKPILSILAKYFEQLFTNPVRTKSITACVLASSASIVSQRFILSKETCFKSVGAYGLFALLFGGTVPHYFYGFIEKVFKEDIKLRKCLIFLSERIFLSPTMIVLSLYFLSIFEGSNHRTSEEKTKKLFFSVLRANWIILSIPSLLNIYFVPPMLRVLTTNIIAFFWIIFVSRIRTRKSH